MSNFIHLVKEDITVKFANMVCVSTSDRSVLGLPYVWPVSNVCDFAIFSYSQFVP